MNSAENGSEIQCHSLKDILIEHAIYKVKIMIIDVKKGKETSKLRLRKVTFYDRANKWEFEFLTNLFELSVDLIATPTKKMANRVIV